MPWFNLDRYFVAGVRVTFGRKRPPTIRMIAVPDVTDAEHCMIAVPDVTGAGHFVIAVPDVTDAEHFMIAVPDVSGAGHCM